MVEAFSRAILASVFYLTNRGKKIIIKTFNKSGDLLILQKMTKLDLNFFFR